MHGMTRGRKEDIANYKIKTIQIGATGALSFQFKRHHLLDVLQIDRNVQFTIRQKWALKRKISNGYGPLKRTEP